MATSPPLVFGREPAFYVGLIEAALVVVLSFNVFHLTTDTIGIIMAAVTAGFGFFTAWVTYDSLLGVGIGLVKALLSLFVVFGLSFSQDQSVAIIGLATILIGAYHRTQTSPVPPAPAAHVEPAPVV